MSGAAITAHLVVVVLVVVLGSLHSNILHKLPFFEVDDEDETYHIKIACISLEH